MVGVATAQVYCQGQSSMVMLFLDFAHSANLSAQLPEIKESCASAKTQLQVLAHLTKISEWKSAFRRLAFITFPPTLLRSIHVLLIMYGKEVYFAVNSILNSSVTTDMHP